LHFYWFRVAVLCPPHHYRQIYQKSCARLNAAYLLWCPKHPNRKKALLPNEAKLFTPKLAFNQLEINNMQFSRFGLAFQNKGVQLHVLPQYMVAKRPFQSPKERRQTTTCRRPRLGISASFSIATPKEESLPEKPGNESRRS
jgi:hypothetical protein